MQRPAKHSHQPGPEVKLSFAPSKPKCALLLGFCPFDLHMSQGKGEGSAGSNKDAL